MSSKQESTVDKEWPDHVQLRLRMSSEQINARRTDDRNRGNASDGKSATRLFNALHASVWAGTTRKLSPNSKDVAYWERRASMAREIAERKTNRKQRRYWNKVARRYDEQGTSVHASHSKT